jgi:hypothetical protein
MRCPIETPENAGLLLAYCSRKLDPAAAAILEDHVRICPACREFADGQRAVWRALDSWEAQPVSADFDRRLYQHIEQDISWWDRLLRPVRPLLVHRGLPITVAAAVLIVAGVLLERPAGIAPISSRTAQTETVAPEQAERALIEMEMIREFSVILKPEAPGPRM